MNEEKLLFIVREHPSGHEYKIYTDGSISGFVAGEDQRLLVINKYPQRREEAILAS